MHAAGPPEARFARLRWLLMRNLAHRRILDRLAPALFILIFIGCSSGVVVHDQARAAELVVDFLTSLKSDQGIKLAYEWTDDRYKEEVSFTRFIQIASSIRHRNLGADIHLVGYEVIGSKEAIVVYANSDVNEGKLYFKFSLVGTKTKDYYLINLNTGNSEYIKNGIYREYGRSIIIQGV